MKIGIDARFLTHPQRGGFKTYTENLVGSLAKLDTKNEYVLYLDRPPTDGCKLPVGTNFASRVVPGSVPIIGMPWREQVGLATQATKDRIDLFHAPCLTAPMFLACPLVVTIHDVIWAFPERFSQAGSQSAQRKLMEWYNRLVPLYVSRRASAIITVSRAAKESIIEKLGLNANRVSVTYEAADPSFQVVREIKRIESIRHKYGLHSSYILAIGSADPRKNMSTLVQAYALLSEELRRQYHLVIVWTHSFLADSLGERIEKLNLGRTVHFLENVSNEDLVLLYNASSLFVFPSLYEGFGLPLLEAMACGVPVVAADNSSIPEIVGEAAVLFNAKDAGTMSAAIARALQDEAARERLIQNGLTQVGGFSWGKCAGQTLEVYQHALAGIVQGG